jgi:hypothetical protein
MTVRHLAAAAALAAVGMLAAGCSTSDEPEELTAHITIHVQKDPKSPEKTAVLICPGRKPIERDVCAALDVVAPKVFERVGESRVCTMIYGGPATATMRGTYDDGLVNASFNQANGCEIGRWNQVLPVFKSLGLSS